ncbi:MAG TPA: phosphatase PAP2 family protein [Burkholderiaceae bacterium]|nr:phosphatase PAP2 family protein [Burkholderiaceae bacterium]
MSFNSFSAFLTGAGDSGVLLLLSLISAALIWLWHSGRAAWLLLRSVLLAVLVVTVLKVLFLSCAAHWQPDLVSPSGHACLSAAVFGSLGVVAAAGRGALARLVIALLVALAVAIIASSRVLIGVHTWTEVIVGLLVGVLALVLFAWSYTRSAPPRIELVTFGVTLLATMMLTFGIRLPGESIIRHVARNIGENCELASVERAIRLQVHLPVRE